MSDDVGILGAVDQKSIRYPLIPISETPHRFLVLFDSLSQAFKIMAALVIVETILFVLLHISSTPHVGLYMLSGIFLSIASAAVLRNSYIKISSSGLTFPVLLAPFLHGRLHRNWDDVAAVDLRFMKDSVNYVGGDVLSIEFKSGGHINLELLRMRHDDLVSLQNGLLTHAPPDVLKPAVSDMVTRLDLEATDSTRFVFAKSHRRLLNQQQAFTDKALHPVGSVFFDGSIVVEKHLAAGGNRAIYLVSDNKQARTLKLLEYDLSALDPELLTGCTAALLRDSEPFLNLNIPNLLNLVECKILDERAFLLSEPESETLRKVVQKARLNEKSALSMALKLAEVVAQTTARGLVLGGIRPDSISYSHNGTTMIGEYGFADDIVARFTESIALDAPYAAPERLKGAPCCASDLYSIGAVMYFALTASDPQCMSAGSVRAINKKISHGTDSLIQKLMHSDAANRGTASELIQALGGTGYALNMQQNHQQVSIHSQGGLGDE